MNAPACLHPLELDALLAYWLGELDEERTQRVDEHLLGCDRCGARLDEVIALGEGVRSAFDAGLVGSVVGADFAQRLAERGLRVREYRVERDGGVNCSVAPDDDVVLTRLRAPLTGIARLDLVHLGAAGQPDVRAADIPFDPERGEVVFVSPAARLREMPSCVHRVRLLAVDASGERPIGDYTFHHRGAS